MKRMQDINRGDKCTLSSISMGVHSGTHMDAPAHYLRKGDALDTMPPDAGLGRARVISIRDAVSIQSGELERHRVRRGERILFRTRNSRRCWRTDRFMKDFVYISEDAAQYLAEQRVSLVGIDYLSVGGYRAGGRETHEILLRAGIWIIEGLNLSRVRPGPVEMVCLPMKLMNAEGAPARVLVRPRPR
jgi:arylformamidase